MIVSEHIKIPCPRPWHSVAASLELTVAEAPPDRSACIDCLGMCCWSLVLTSSSIISTIELEAIERYLNYRALTVWSDLEGRYNILAITPCAYLDRKTAACRIHFQPEHPQTCSRYDESNCFYRCHFDGSPYILGRFDRDRWLGYRRTVKVARGGFVFELPGTVNIPQSDDPSPRDPRPACYDVPATLSWPLVTPREPTEAFGEYLYFASHFRSVSLVRVDDQWSVLLRTQRTNDGPGLPTETEGGPVRIAEMVDGVVLSNPRSAQLHLCRADTHYLRNQVGWSFYTLPTKEVRKLLSRRPPGTAPGY